VASGSGDLGHSSGVSVEEDPDGGFRWSAFGPAGTRHGRAEPREQAEAAARDAETKLKRAEELS
jgi:hypothetical protein